MILKHWIRNTVDETIAENAVEILEVNKEYNPKIESLDSDKLNLIIKNILDIENLDEVEIQSFYFTSHIGEINHNML